MSNFILFHVMNEKNEADIGPELVETGAIATIKPTDAGQSTRVTLKDGRAFKVTGKFEDFRDMLVGGPIRAVTGPLPTKTAAGVYLDYVAQKEEVITAKDDELNEEEKPVDKDKNKSLTQKKK